MCDSTVPTFCTTCVLISFARSAYLCVCGRHRGGFRFSMRFHIKNRQGCGAALKGGVCIGAWHFDDDAVWHPWQAPVLSSKLLRGEKRATGFRGDLATPDTHTGRQVTTRPLPTQAAHSLEGVDGVVVLVAGGRDGRDHGRSAGNGEMVSDGWGSCGSCG